MVGLVPQSAMALEERNSKVDLAAISEKFAFPFLPYARSQQPSNVPLTIAGWNNPEKVSRTPP